MLVHRLVLRDFWGANIDTQGVINGLQINDWRWYESWKTYVKAQC